MNMIKNFQLEFEKTIQSIQEKSLRPKLLLHSCCGPCSSSVLEKLVDFFEVTIFYYNPNIYPDTEYRRRFEEQRELLLKINFDTKISLLEGDYTTEYFYQAVKGFEKEREGGERCFRCYEMRLRQAAKIAAEAHFDYFTTTLSVSPHKNSVKLNEIGKKLAEEFQVAYLFSDFKKKEGYKRSLELSKKYGLYRQEYCGCIYSWQERQKQKAEKEEASSI